MSVRAAALLLAAAWLLAACTVLTPVPPGGRQWIITVDNDSNAPVKLFVAEDESPMGDTVGTAMPDTVPPGAKVDVVFTVPAGRTWAIFVNPTNERGPLVLAQDVPANVTGKLPLTITVNGQGEPGASLPGDLPGWFGNP